MAQNTAPLRRSTAQSTARKPTARSIPAPRARAVKENPTIQDPFAEEPKDNNAVFVYCKLPAGLILPTPTGKVKLRGVNESRIVDANGEKSYGITKGLPEQWDYIARVYGSLPAFHTVPPAIYAEDSRAAGDERAEEEGDNVETGLEQMDIEADQTAQKAGLKPLVR